MMGGAIKAGADNSSKPVAAKFSPIMYYKRRSKGMRCRPQGPGQKKARTDSSDPFAVPNLLEELNCSRFGSVTDEIKDLLARRSRAINSYFRMHSSDLDVEKKLTKEESQVKQLETPLALPDVILLEDNSVADHAVTGRLEVVHIDSDVEETGDQRRLEVVHIDSDVEEKGDQRPFNPYREPAAEFLVDDFLVNKNGEYEDRDWTQNQSNYDPRLSGETVTRKDKGVYVGVEDDIQSEDSNCQTDSNYDGLADIWKEMNVAFECCKDTTEDPLPDELVREGLDECDHTFVLKDDLGYVCRICGVIQRGIETIIEYQYAKGTRTTRTYWYEGRSTKDMEPTEILRDGVKLPGQDFIVSEISVHPRHRKQMKPHQVAGFNFLLSNLVAENPGGCIMAHAPGSGKTFMIISFIQSFLAKYPNARPLVVLPRGILAIWKKEFQRWQIEEIPLYDFYSARADNRSQQLEVLKKWEDHKSILFLGYKQFSSIVCDNETDKTSATCQELLLTCPSILILDEGHTPRNEDTDVLNSLKKVRTPRKVVLSGTLYQNHVKEVFNIFDLVRPKFIRWDTSRAIMRRILSRVSRKNVKAKGLENAFYEAVECTLQKDDDFKRKISVIQDLREMTSKVLHFYKGDFLDELPGLVDFTVLLDLSPRQKLEVEDLKKIGKKFKISSDGSALYVHPQLRYPLKKSSCRERERPDDTEMDQLLEKVEVREGVKAKFFLNLLGLCESGGEKLLVFSQYLQPLKFLERLVVKVKGWSLGKEIFVITGDSNSENREWSMDCFNTSADARVFFGSIKACGEGISLVGASRIIILDVHLNPSVTRQAIGRAFRPGQVKKVYTYRLVAADSPEEEDHSTCSKKESISKMWFEWNECCGHKEFEMQSVDVNNCGDLFLESPKLSENVKALYKW
ncbi:hypothetical protein RHMOL_Rhmol11G0264900 [Rhododendron molle]|uniref:Uncharacterized protein n=1 Tax=Rhododendron molle TaxID=49168 RepID=A0ACC0LWD4_RHOML|nr:hypothetical protein RHMOL_Rhmol11G0264900 [Rhododendron molle]